MMKRIGQLVLMLTVLCNYASAGEFIFDEVYVDAQGVMRHSKSGEEASFYGVNYTLPFAHAYRAAGYMGKEPKQCIDEDIYHITRMGMNAYRIHIWDVEISDSEGNLIANDHLDLLDYLMYKLQERGIYTLITLQTNFGNGYPERNQPTGAYTYLYDKCDIHSNPKAIEAQKRYSQALINHVNPYTGTVWGSDPSIVGFEINNEPCHSVSKEDTRNYLDQMVASLRQTGTTKPIFYNVSHNMGHQEAYYGADIQGTTYQWYPIGLVGGHTRKGNFLPYVDNYAIPFDTVAGFENKAKIVYEFDPADILYSYMYPAICRTFRSAGFQWITQFAYDPLAIAWANTEYQTHYLNLLYTPQKALSMKIAGAVAREIPRNASFAPYPADTVFGNFTVSYERDLSLYNSKNKYYYSNHTDVKPRNVKTLEEIAGFGNSPVVAYNGTGAYFLDKIDKGVWRLEVMPDEVTLSDPFKKTSLKKQVSAIQHNTRQMTVLLPDLGETFVYQGINTGNVLSGNARKGSVELIPGTYLLKSERVKTPDLGMKHGNIQLCEYVAPASNVPVCRINHTPEPMAYQNRPLRINTIAASEYPIDSIVLYTDQISFWNEENPYVKLEPTIGFEYTAEIPAEWLSGDKLRYNLVAYSGGKAYTWPEGVEGMPLDWDYISESHYETPLYGEEAPMVLIDPVTMKAGQEIYTVPDWGEPGDKTYYLKKYIGDFPIGRMSPSVIQNAVEITSDQDLKDLRFVFIDSMGYSYEAVPQRNEKGVYVCDFRVFEHVPTLFLPHAYPVFLNKSFMPSQKTAFDPTTIEYIQVSTTTPLHDNMLTVSLK